MKNNRIRAELSREADRFERGWGNALAWISVLWLILTSGGAYYNSAGVVNVVLLMSVVFSVLQLYFSWEGVKEKRGDVLIYAMLVAVLIFLSMIANDDFSSFLSYARIVVVMSLALSTVVFLGVEQFFVRSVYVIALVSLASLFLFYAQILPLFSSFFPSFSSNEYTYLNAFFYSEIDGVERRNAGPFIEPGLFQIYANFSLALVLFGAVRVKAANLHIVVLLATVYSTNSTTGFIIALCTVFLSLGLKETEGRLGAAVKYVLLAGVVVFAGFSDYVTSNIEDKFSNEVNMSFVTRFNSTLIDLAVIEENPVFGGGAGGYGNQLNYYDSRGLVVDAATNTFTQLGAYMGVFLVLLLVFRSLSFFVFAFRYARASVAFVVWYMFSFSTEPFLFFPFFYVFPFLSFLPFGLTRGDDEL